MRALILLMVLSGRPKLQVALQAVTASRGRCRKRNFEWETSGCYSALISNNADCYYSCLLLFLSTLGRSLKSWFLHSTPNQRPESDKPMATSPTSIPIHLARKISQNNAYFGCSIHILSELLVWTANLIHHETW